MLNETRSPSCAPSLRKQRIRRLSDDMARDRERGLKKAATFHDEELLYLKYLIPEGGRVLELGGGNGHLLADLKPSFRVGVDFSEATIDEDRTSHPHPSFV